MGILDDLARPRREPRLTLDERLELDFNDEDNAERLLAVHGGDLVHVSGRCWAVWDGTRYSYRSGDLAAREMGHHLRRLVREEEAHARGDWEPPEKAVKARIAAAKRAGRDESPAEARRVVKWMRGNDLGKHARACGNVSKVRAALEVCQYRRRAEVDDMDADPWALVVPNGQIDLRAVRDFDRPVDAAPDEVAGLRWKAWLRDVDRAARPTKCAGVLFDPWADCPRWRAFLELVLPDPEIRACAQRLFGALLFGRNRAQVAILMRGAGGNGKTTLINVLRHVLGAKDGYGQSCRVEMFLETGVERSSAATPDEVNLPGARAYFASEPSARDALSAKKIKAMTGGDERMSRGNFQDFFFWHPTGVPVLSFNRTPKIKDEDAGTRRRLVFLPFDVDLRALPEAQQRPPDEVEAELRAEGSGILNWLLGGFGEFMHLGIAMPAKMAELKAELLQAADPVGTFIDQMCEIDGAGRLNVTEFYKTFERWCGEEGHTLYNMNTVGKIMVEKGYKRAKVRGRSAWVGLAWSEDARRLVADLGFDPPPSARPAPEPF